MHGAEEDERRDQDCKKEWSNGADRSVVSDLIQLIVLINKLDITVLRIFLLTKKESPSLMRLLSAQAT